MAFPVSNGLKCVPRKGGLAHAPIFYGDTQHFLMTHQALMVIVIFYY